MNFIEAVQKATLGNRIRRPYVGYLRDKKFAYYDHGTGRLAFTYSGDARTLCRMDRDGDRSNYNRFDPPVADLLATDWEVV